MDEFGRVWHCGSGDGDYCRGFDFADAFAAVLDREACKQMGSLKTVSKEGGHSGQSEVL